MNLTRRKVEKILSEVKTALEEWETCAEQAALDERTMDFIRRNHRRI